MVYAVAVVYKILSYMAEHEVAMPIQVERDLKISRYLVFGSLAVLEELGLVKPVAKRGNWKLYKITSRGIELLEKGKTEIELKPRAQEPA